jgi:hypothetical protein
MKYERDEARKVSGRVYWRKLKDNENSAGVQECVVGSLPQRDEGTRQTTMGVICTSVNIPYSRWCSSFLAEIKWVSTCGPARKDVKALLSPSV